MRIIVDDDVDERRPFITQTMETWLI